MYVIGTAGHVDHGKSTLVHTLTGVDPDRWQEEKDRGLTIDLGFGELTLPSGRTVSIVDVPGHERFIKNMLAGAGGIDLALLVIAADGGVMPQTREHLAIIDLLGVRHGIVAITRTDTVDDDVVALACAEAAELIAETSLTDSPIVACSALTGAGIDAIVAAIDAVLASAPRKRDVGKPLLPIDRAFTMTGFGTVVTGTLIDGSFRNGQAVEILPARLRTRIRGIQTHGRQVEEALPGTRTALNLAGIAMGQLARGMVVTLEDQHSESLSLDVRLRAVPYLAQPIRHNLNVTVHTGAAEAPARLILLDCDAVEPGGSAWAQLRLTTPVVVVARDHFVIRDANGTLGGGHAVQLNPPRHRRRHPPTIAALEILDLGSPEERLLAFIEQHQPVAGETLSGLETGISAVDLVERLSCEGRIVALSPQITDATLLYTADGYTSVRARLEDLLTKFHASAPLRQGMPRGELGQRLGLTPKQLDPLLGHLTTEGAIKDGDHLALPDFTPSPTPEQLRAAATYLSQLSAAPFAPPTGLHIDPDLLAYLIATGTVVDAGDGVVFPADAYAAMTGRVTDHITSNGALTLAQVRDMFGTTRKYAQALLETMDRQHLTRRVGDERVLYQSRA
jgi:selenocysteine-specific elongation factor